MRSQIKSLTFNKSNNESDCFTGEYDNKVVTGSNETGKFLINNSRNFNEIAITCLEYEIEKRFNIKDIRMNAPIHTN